MTGGHYDIVGIDPRGTGETIPVDCYPDPLERVQQALRMPPLANFSNTALGATWAFSQTYADRCLENAAEYGELMGTAFVARDFMQVVDALGEDGMLRYWGKWFRALNQDYALNFVSGQSYGTTLGATLAAMFPERIDKMVIDGVENTRDYSGGWYDRISTSLVTRLMNLPQVL